MPAFGREILERRQAGERFGLLILSIDDWKGGEVLADRPGVARLVVTAELEFERLDLSIVAGCDVLVCGLCAPARFDAAVLACLAAGAATVWGEFQAGWTTALWRVESLAWPPPYWVCVDGPYECSGFGAVLASYRETAILLGLGFYGGAVFGGVQDEMWRRVLAGKRLKRTPFERVAVLAGSRQSAETWGDRWGYDHTQITHVEDEQTAAECAGYWVLPDAVDRANYAAIIRRGSPVMATPGVGP